MPNQKNNKLGNNKYGYIKKIKYPSLGWTYIIGEYNNKIPNNDKKNNNIFFLSLIIDNTVFLIMIFLSY